MFETCCLQVPLQIALQIMTRELFKGMVLPGVNSTVGITDLDKLNLVKIFNDGLVLDFSQFPKRPSCIKK